MNTSQHTINSDIHAQPAKRSFLQNFYDAWKICKYEFLMSRILVVLTCIVVISMLCIYLLQKVQYDSDSYALEITINILIAILSSALFIFIISYFLSAAVSFYHGIFGRNAYLTHSLPISLDSILLSKIFVFVLWSAVFGVELILISFLFEKTTIGRFLDIYYYQSFPSLLQALITPIFRWLQFTIGEITYIFMIVALIHRKKTFTMFYGIMLYFLIKVLLGILFAIVLVNGGSEYYIEYVRYYNNLQITDIGFWVINLLFFIPSCIFYFICRLIIKYRLTL